MKVILYMATSINGRITVGASDSDWVADWKEFEKMFLHCGNILMGKNTYKIWGDEFPDNRVLNVVMTSDQKLLKQKTADNVIFTNKSPQQVIKLIAAKGHKQIMLIGGEKLNTSFLKANLIDEIWLDIHPLIIGKGLEVFANIKKYIKKLKRLGVKKLNEDLVQIRYKIIK